MYIYIFICIIFIYVYSVLFCIRARCYLKISIYKYSPFIHIAVISVVACSVGSPITVFAICERIYVYIYILLICTQNHSLLDICFVCRVSPALFVFHAQRVDASNRRGGAKLHSRTSF